VPAPRAITTHCPPTRPFKLACFGIKGPMSSLPLVHVACLCTHITYPHFTTHCVTPDPAFLPHPNYLKREGRLSTCFGTGACGSRTPAESTVHALAVTKCEKSLRWSAPCSCFSCFQASATGLRHGVVYSQPWGSTDFALTV
jgi:hypothetical protein